MSLDTLQLPALLHCAIFSQKLVYPDNGDLPELLSKKPVIDFLGGNQKKITILFDSTEQKFLSDSDLSFLTLLLSACGLTLADVAVTNIRQDIRLNYYLMLEELQCRNLIGFGITPDNIDLPFTIPFYQLQAYEKTKYIFCPSVQELQASSIDKKKLWSALQKMFNISVK
ncbi:MAG: hypothetical protein ABIR19_09865 [Ginsengibacter sp.]